MPRYSRLPWTVLRSPPCSPLPSLTQTRHWVWPQRCWGKTGPSAQGRPRLAHRASPPPGPQGLDQGEQPKPRSWASPVDFPYFGEEPPNCACGRAPHSSSGRLPSSDSQAGPLKPRHRSCHSPDLALYPTPYPYRMMKACLLHGGAPCRSGLHGTLSLHLRAPVKQHQHEIRGESENPEKVL